MIDAQSLKDDKKKVLLANFNDAPKLVKKMGHWMANNLNVLLRGRHGVGKTSMILEALKRAGFEDDEWLYFSGATLDPWVDFVGVPKEKVDEETGKSYLELVRPKAFLNDRIRFIFIDEYNRTHKKIRNAAMELIQFKSINSHRFPNLDMVWTAINPHEDDELENEYDVEKLDPAQEDRFHIQYDIPYKPDKAFFREKFGEKTADVAIEWWNSLKRGKEKHHLKVSPRRLEYALMVHQANGDIADVLPEGVNYSMLKEKLFTVPSLTQLVEYVNEGDKEAVKKHLSDDNNYDFVIQNIIEDEKLLAFCLPLVKEEKISNLIATNGIVKNFVLAHFDDAGTPYERILDEIADAGLNNQLIRLIVRAKQRREHEKQAREAMSA